VGLKSAGHERHGQDRERFQTHPCGVEVARPCSLACHSSRFQTHPCGVEVTGNGLSLAKASKCFRRTLVGLKSVSRHPTRLAWDSFRRTLVGLKFSSLPESTFLEEFQTHPCGVEVVKVASIITLGSMFQTHPCGVEVPARSPVGPPAAGFRRTLVGLKFSANDATHATQRFQTHPCGVEVLGSLSTSQHFPGFRRTLVGLK